MTISATRAPGHLEELEHGVGSNRDELRIRHILVCLDRSAPAEGCLPHARSVAAPFDAKLTLLHVMASPEGDQPPTRLDALDWEITRRESEEYLRRIQEEQVGSGVPRERVTTAVTQGRPAERIVKLASELRADLTVLASHGEGGRGAWNLGSTAQQVLALAPGSLLVVPPDPSARNVPAKRIMVAVDGSLRTQSVLPEVALLAKFHGAEVLLVHAVTEPKRTGVLSDEDDLALAQALASRLEVKAEAYLARLHERFFAGVARVETLVLRHHDERRTLLEAASHRQADLLVVAAHGATCDPERPFGSVTAYLLAHGRLPLLVLQDLPVPERESRRASASGIPTPTSTRALFGARALEET